MAPKHRWQSLAGVYLVLQTLFPNIVFGSGKHNDTTLLRI